MNWKEIKEKFPKAFKCLIDWWSDAISTDFSKAYGSNFNDDYIDLFMPTRDLYDFFDENDIYITLDTTLVAIPSRTIRHKLHLCFIWYILASYRPITEDCYHDKYPYKLSRTDAEAAAFEKAFEILETKLSANSK